MMRPKVSSSLSAWRNQRGETNDWQHAAQCMQRSATQQPEIAPCVAIPCELVWWFAHHHAAMLVPPALANRAIWGSMPVAAPAALRAAALLGFPADHTVSLRIIPKN